MLFRLDPEAARELEEATQWYLERGWPLADEIVVLAVMHQKRRPGYWRDRL